MSEQNKIMTEALSAQIAKELGVSEIVKTKGWGDVSARDCGNIVRKAFEIANRSVSGK